MFTMQVEHVFEFDYISVFLVKFEQNMVGIREVYCLNGLKL